MANVALLRRPAQLDQASWLTRWQHDHTPVAIETQSTFGYTQNAVVRSLTPNAPELAGIVESDAPTHSVYDPGNSAAGDDGYVQMPNVSSVDEMVNMLSAQQDYQANLEAFNVAKTLAVRTLTI